MRLTADEEVTGDSVEAELVAAESDRDVVEPVDVNVESEVAEVGVAAAEDRETLLVDGDAVSVVEGLFEVDKVVG